MSKPKVAFFEFTSCEGCQLTVVDSLQTNVELLDAIEIVQFREAMSEKGQDYQIAFIEGSCTRPSDEAVIKRIREQADIVVALGSCADLGGINAIRNYQDLDDVRHYVYGDKADWYETYPARPIRLTPRSPAARSTGTSSSPRSKRCFRAGCRKSRITRSASSAS